MGVESLSLRWVGVARGMEQLSASSVILGIGPQASPHWFDNSVIRLLIDSGVAGLVCFTIALGIFLVNVHKRADSEQKRSYFYILLVATSAFVVNNFSTEFFLVTRIGFPFVIFLGLLYKLVGYPDASSEVNRRTSRAVAGRV